MEIVVVLLGLVGGICFLIQNLVVSPGKPPRAVKAIKAAVTKEIDSGEEDWRKDIETYQRKQKTVWDAEFEQTMREAWADSIGISLDNVERYINTLRQCIDMRKYLQYMNVTDTQCRDEGDTYTVGTIGSPRSMSYSTPCKCDVCKVVDYRRQLEVKEDIIRILDRQIRLKNPTYTSPLDIDDQGQKMIESWETYLPTER